MFLDGEKPLGIPMELAESRRASAALPQSPFRKFLRLLYTALQSKSVNICFVFLVGFVLTIAFFVFTEKRQTQEQQDTVELLVITGQRVSEHINSTSPVDMSVYLNIKNKTSNPTKRKRRAIKGKKVETVELENGKIINVAKAREIIENHNEPCDPDKTNEFCRHLIQKLNDAVIKETLNTPIESRNFHKKELVTEKNKIKEGIISQEVPPNGVHKREERATTMVDSAFDHDFTDNYRSSHIQGDSRNPYEYGNPSPIFNTYQYPVPPRMPVTTNDCPLARLLRQYNFPDPLNYYGAQGYPQLLPNAYQGNLPLGSPYLPSAINSPLNYESYAVHPAWPYREATGTAFDQSRHPQDVGISFHLKSTKPSAIAPKEHLPKHQSKMRAACAEGSIPCASNEGCIDSKNWCNGFVDCMDASDETNCTCKSRISSSRICDGYFDCPFGEDEMGCLGCSAHTFSCEDVTDVSTVSTCFEKKQRCDDVIDCPNGKDETECNLLAPSLHDKSIFSISHTQGFLHRNFKGKWYPVCENPYMWAHDACRRETGILMQPPFIQLTRIDPSFKGHFMNSVHGHVFEMSPSCFNSSAVYVFCQDLLCGTRVDTNMQTLNRNAAFENTFLSRNKRASSTPNVSEKLSTPNKRTTEGPTSLEIASNDGRLNIEADVDVDNHNITKRGYYAKGGRSKRTDARVVGGVPSRPGAWPWMVAILRDGMFECGGVIVSHRWILSAAHCVHKFWEHYYEVQVGMLRRFSFSPQEQNHKVTHVIVNRLYNRRDMRNDLSLLRVAPAVQFSRWVRPICLPAPNTAGATWKWGPKAGTMCTAVGWGAMVEHGPDPDHMREVEVPIWAECKYKVDRAGNEICAGAAEGGKDSCQGDSGGPLLCKNPLNPKQWYIAGIVSHGEGCARAYEPGVYTRVSLYVDWIHFHLESQNLPSIKPKQDCPGFKCVSGISKCLPNNRLCNEVIDCLDGEDELDCIYARRSNDYEDESFPSITQKSHDSTNAHPESKNITKSHVSEQKSPSSDQTTPTSQNNVEIMNTFTDPPQSETSHKESFKMHSINESNIIKDTKDLIHTGRTINQVLPPGDSDITINEGNVNEFGHVISTTTENFDNFWEDEPEIEIEKTVHKIHSKVEAAMSEDKFKLPSIFTESGEKNQTKETKFKVDGSSNELFTEEPSPSSSKEEVTTLSNIKSEVDFENVDVLSNQRETSDVNSTNNGITAVEEQNESTTKPDFTTPSTSFLVSIINNTGSLANKTQENLLSNKTIENRGLPDSKNMSPPVDIDNNNLHNIEPQHNTQEVNPVTPSNLNHSENTNEIHVDGPKQKELPNHVLDHTTPPSQSQIPEDRTLPFSQLPERHNASNNLDAGKGENHLPHKENLLIPTLVKKKALLPTLFECKRMPQIIHFNLRCNHIADCEDGTDELGCSCVDYLAAFNTNLLCDGVVDCADGLDEVNCNVCNEGYFLCKWSKMCLPFEYVCDGRSHCAEGEDELDCYALTNGKYMTFDADKRPHVNLEGFLTMRKQNSWKVVCEDNMSKGQQEEAATHICHYLGFSGYNQFTIQHIHMRSDQLVSINRNKRSTGSNGTIQFVHESRDSDGNTMQERVISNPVILPYHCVPNVTRTCMTLYVSCDSTLNSEISSHKLVPSQTHYPIKTSNEISTEKSDDYLWPWAAKIFIEGRYRCTGVLVDLSWVMLSDSCLWDTLLDKDYMTVVLGSKRLLAATSGPFEQMYEVDGKKDIFDSRVTLLHLKEPAQYSRMVKPMVLPPSSNMQQSDSNTCVAVGQDHNNNTITVLLEEINSDCGSEKRCFVRHNPGKVCLSDTYNAPPWSGIICCRGKGGWFPAASYVEPKGECGFLGQFEARSLVDLRTNVKNVIASKSLSSFIVSKPPACPGVRCARGACVPLARACDGVRDCEDGRDELDAACEKKIQFCSVDPYDFSCACSAEQLKCKNGRCISKKHFANGIDDCGDGSDEPQRTTCAQYLERVAPDRLCDGKLHCFDRSDEDPLFCKCFGGRTFECVKSKTCVAQDLVCDGIKDCPRGEDETSCMALAGPAGAPYGIGEVLVRRYGVWHTKCYLNPNHTRSELERICRDLGFYSGHALLRGSPVQPSFNSNTNILLDPFTDVALNDQTTIKLRNNDKPMARAVADEAAENCYPAYIECV